MVWRLDCDKSSYLQLWNNQSHQIGQQVHESILHLCWWWWRINYLATWSQFLIFFFFFDLQEILTADTALDNSSWDVWLYQNCKWHYCHLVIWLRQIFIFPFNECLQMKGTIFHSDISFCQMLPTFTTFYQLPPTFLTFHQFLPTFYVLSTTFIKFY